MNNFGRYPVVPYRDASRTLEFLEYIGMVGITKTSGCAFLGCFQVRERYRIILSFFKRHSSTISTSVNMSANVPWMMDPNVLWSRRDTFSFFVLNLLRQVRPIISQLVRKT